METINLGTKDNLPPVDWAAIVATLEVGAAPAADAHNAHSTWLTTVNADGSPHLTPVGAIWLDGTFWFQTGPHTVKAKNIARDARCAVSLSIRDADVVLEGDAERVTDRTALERAVKPGRPTVAGPPRWTQAVPASRHRSTLLHRDPHRGTCTGSGPVPPS